MNLKNYERELKYLELSHDNINFEHVLDVFLQNGYEQVEGRNKKKLEAYYDDENFSIIKKGDVIRSSTHYNENGTFTHFMYKKNVSDHDKPYVSKYEYGSDRFASVKEFLSMLGVNDVNILLDPVLYGIVTRKTAVFEKNHYRLLISYDNTEYSCSPGDNTVMEKMLEVEDWTNPYTTTAEKDPQDFHLIEINNLLMRNLPIALTKYSKPYRGLFLLGVSGFELEK